MRRKLIKHGPTSYIISLPIEWIRELNLKKGDELELSPFEETLMLSTVNNRKLTRVQLDVSVLGPLTKRALTSNYKNGCDEIIAKFKTPADLDNIQRIVRDNLIGFEIIDLKKSSCTIRIITTTLDDELENILRSSFLSTLSMFERLGSAVKRNDHLELRNIRAQEAVNNRYTIFCKRVLEKKLSLSKVSYVHADYLEKLADEIKYLCDYVLSTGQKVNHQSFQKAYEKTLSLIRDYHALHYSFEISAAISFRSKAIETIEEFLNYFDSKENNNQRSVHHLVNIIQILLNMLSCRLQSYYLENLKRC